MAEHHSDRPAGHRPDGQPAGKLPGTSAPEPSSTDKAIRQNPMSPGPEDPLPTPGRGRLAEPDPASPARGGAAETAPEQAAAAHVDSAMDSDEDASARLFETAHVEEFRRRWDAIKAAFVDNPKEAVQRAEELTDEVVSELTAAVEARRRDLAERRRDSGTTGNKAETERLRVVLHGYRSVLDPVLRS